MNLPLPKPPQSALFKWLVFAFLLRLIRAWTDASWVHPDEWFQTVELAQLLSQGTASWSQEIVLHIRNLSWPVLLSLPLTLSHWIAPDWIRLRLFSAQLFVGTLDLGVIWGWWQVQQAWTRGHPDFKRWQPFVMASAILPFFLIRDSVSLSIEHASAIATWLMLGCLATNRWRLAGLLAVAIAAFRYPSGLISAGVFIALWVQAWRAPSSLKTDLRQHALRFTQGTLLGLVLFGIPDLIYYGRPWESLWMYLQYNALTGLSGTKFGVQPAWIYFDFFWDRWGGILFPLGLIGITCGAVGISQRLRSGRWLEPWFWAFTLYVGAHLIVPHKEPRFMAPIELLLIWAAWEGWTVLSSSTRLRPWSTYPAVRIALVLLFIANGGLAAFSLWGDTWKTDTQFFNLSNLLKNHPKTCAIITVKRHQAFIYPNEALSTPPSVPLGHLDMDRSAPSYPPHGDLIWAERAPSCTAGQSILLQVHRPDEKWLQNGCIWQRFGAYRVLPELWIRWLDRRRLISGPWYICPATTTGLHLAAPVEHPLVRSFSPLAHLPPLGSPGSLVDEIKVSDIQKRGGCSHLCPGATN